MTLRDAKCGLSDGHSDRPSLALAARMQPPPLALASNNMARSTPRNWARGHRGRSRSAMPMFDVILTCSEPMANGSSSAARKALGDIGRGTLAPRGPSNS